MQTKFRQIRTRVVAVHREKILERGYLCVQDLIPVEQMDALRRVTEEFVDASRQFSESDNVYDLSPEHGYVGKHSRRMCAMTSTGIVHRRLADVAADLVGPDAVFHHSKLNFKWFDDTDQVKWHQDAQFSHTNYNVLTIGMYLHDTNMDNGPLAVVACHDGPLFDQYDGSGSWVGHLSDEDAACLDLDKVEYLTGNAGSITIHSCRTVHGSPANAIRRGRYC